jgi:clan AA aspartic protease (TIGR02281 family)
MMTLIDILLLTVLALSALAGMLRGLTRELLALAAWAGALLIALQFAPWGMSQLPETVGNADLRRMLALGGLFIGALLALTLVNVLLHRLLLKHAMDSHDTLFGLFFGILRGVVLLTIAVALGQMGLFNQTAWWRSSQVIVQVEQLLTQVQPHLPEEVARFMVPASQPLTTRKLTLLPDLSGHYVADGLINGLVVEFLLDTGATLVTIPPKVQQQLQLALGEAVEVQTAAGPIQVYPVQLKSLTLGQMQLYDLKAMYNPQTQDERVLLGMNALREMHLQQVGSQLILEQTQVGH